MFKGKKINNTKACKNKITRYLKDLTVIFNPKAYANNNNLK
jgi:hypothetical protein